MSWEPHRYIFNSMWSKRSHSGKRLEPLLEWLWWCSGYQAYAGSVWSSGQTKFQKQSIPSLQQHCLVPQDQKIWHLPPCPKGFNAHRSRNVGGSWRCVLPSLLTFCKPTSLLTWDRMMRMCQCVTWDEIPHNRATTLHTCTCYQTEWRV